MTGQVLCANRLDTGQVVYLGLDGRWATGVAGALVTHDDELRDAATATLAATGGDFEVVGAEWIAVEVSGSVIEPVRLRERIRLDGPTIDYTGTN